MCTYPVQPICTFSCTSVFFFINIYYPQYTVLHILFYYLSPFSFSPIVIYIFSCVMFHCFIAYVIFIFYFIIIIILFFLHCPLSGPVPTYISLLIIPCMIVYVTNNKEPWTLNLIYRLVLLMQYNYLWWYFMWHILCWNLKVCSHNCTLPY